MIRHNGIIYHNSSWWSVLLPVPKTEDSCQVAPPPDTAGDQDDEEDQADDTSEDTVGVVAFVEVGGSSFCDGGGVLEIGVVGLGKGVGEGEERET